MNQTLANTLETNRTADRVDTRIRVRHGTDDPSQLDFATNISEAGLCIDTNRVYPVGTRLVLQLEFPGHTVRHDGEVAWAIKVPDHLRSAMVCGMGITFIRPDPAWAAFFRRFKFSRLD
jgi:uncharacterized protein (TIGR02266 family)